MARTWGEEALTANVLETVKCSCDDQILNIFLITLREIYAFNKIEDGRVGSILLTFLNDGGNSCFTNPFDSCHTKTDVTFGVDGELMA